MLVVIIMLLGNYYYLANIDMFVTETVEAVFEGSVGRLHQANFIH